MVKTLIISQFCLNAADGMLIFVLNIIIIIIIIMIFAPATTLSAGYWIENEIYSFARGNSKPVAKIFFTRN